jgi:ATP adenylyltransferase
VSDRLWAPWRIGFILSEKSGGCFLCDAPASDKDEENLLLERGRRCIAILNRYPYNNGHLMIAPLRHTGDLTSLDADESLELMQMTQTWIKVLDAAMHPHGYNLGFNLGIAAGAGVADHVHFHIVPRWNGDTNFMSIVGEERVINQSLAEAYALLVRVRRPEVGK